MWFVKAHTSRQFLRINSFNHSSAYPLSLILLIPFSDLSFFFFRFYFTLFYFTILYWFCHTSTWIHHGCTRVPNPEPPSHHPPYTISLDHPSAPAPSILYPASNIDWWFVSYIIHVSMPFWRQHTLVFSGNFYTSDDYIILLSTWYYSMLFCWLLILNK